MANVEELPSALRQGMGVCFTVCLVVMTCGYGGFGKPTQDVIIDSLTSSTGVPFYSGQVAAVGILVNLFISAPLIFYSVTSFVESTGNDTWRTPMSKANILFRLSLMTFCIVLGALISFAKTLIGLVSALFGSFNCVFFPLLFFYTLRARAKQSERCDEVPPVSVLRRITHVAVFMVGVIACLFGCIGGVEELLIALESASVGFC